MALLSARSFAEDLVEIQGVHRLLRTRVLRLREKAVKGIVDALYRRYWEQTKELDEPRPTPRQWLIAKGRLELTYRSTGPSLPVRRGWSISQTKHLFRKELSLPDDTEGLWVLKDLQAAIDRKFGGPGPEVAIVIDDFVENKTQRLPGGPSLHFQVA